MRMLLVLAGGALGTSARYLTGVAMAGWFGTEFPWSTFAVNVTGSFLIGLLATLADEVGAMGGGVRVFLVIGVLGGFTTFSSFSLETMRLAEDGEFLQAAGNVLLNLVLGLGATMAGILAARAFE